VDKVYYLCCKLPTSQNSSQMSLLANDEVDDWKHLSEKLIEHDNSVEHIINIEKLLEIFNVHTIIIDFASKNARRNSFV